MAKLTLSGLKTLVNTELDVDRIAVDAPFEPTVERLTGLIVKIGDQYDISSSFEDKLGHLTHKYLGYGTTVEEWFVNLRLPVDHDASGSTNMAPKDPTFEDVAYSYVLDKKVMDTTIRNEDIKKGFLGEAEFSALTARIGENLYKAQSLHRYFVKKGLLGRFIDAIPANSATSTMQTQMAKPTDTASVEAFAKAVKNKIEDLSDLITDTNNITGVPARAPELTLYLLPGIRSVIDVDLLAGAFNQNRAEIGVKIIVVEDFGNLSVNTGAWGLLVDDRGLRVYPSQAEADHDRNGQGGFTNLYLKEAYTVIYSKVINAHLFTT